jgi:hypothetical protein
MVFCDGHVESPPLTFLFAAPSATALRRWNRDHHPRRTAGSVIVRVHEFSGRFGMRRVFAALLRPLRLGVSASLASNGTGRDGEYPCRIIFMSIKI